MGGMERYSVLIRTNTYNTEPIEIKPDMRVMARKVFNRFPFQEKLKSIYHSLPYWAKKL